MGGGEEREKMESKKDKLEVIQLAVKQIMEDGKEKKNNLDGSFVLVNNDDEDNRLLLTGLLYQVQFITKSQLSQYL